MTNVVASVSRRTIWASQTLGPPSYCHFFPSSSSFTAPSSLSFPASSSLLVFAGHLCRLEILVGVGGWPAKMTTTSIMVHFWDVLHAPPSPWVPSMFLTPQFPLSSKNRPAHIPVERGEVAMAESSLLRKLEGCWLSPHPFKEGRGSWSGGFVWLGLNCGEMVGRKDRG
jgi:hypothetical protein